MERTSTVHQRRTLDARRHAVARRDYCNPTSDLQLLLLIYPDLPDIQLIYRSQSLFYLDLP